MRHERRRVTIVAETEMDDVERRREFGCVPTGCGLEIGGVNRHRMGPCRDLLKQRVGEPRQIAIGTAQRSDPLIHLKHVYGGPRNLRLTQTFEDRPGCATARECD